ncbi:MAG: gliding motility-associated C-terminal domain-containing protein [Flavobacteriales bacterium]|nr:gliding motility-associated C-terminal domain-containing protein [Flavobacteriales bacterium]
MPRTSVVRSLLIALLLLGLSKPGTAQPQIFSFTSGPIPPCDTSIFTANIWGVGTLVSSGWGGWGVYSLASLGINITTDHPEFLQITLTSPAGTDLLLSEFNGAGGQNYTGTNFVSGGSDITAGAAPFTGYWAPQGGNFDVFDYEDGNGAWTITVIDTACATPGGGPGGGVGWNPGWFDGSSTNGGFTIAFIGPPPCYGYIPFGSATLCPGETFDIANYYESLGTGYIFTYSMPDGWTPIPDPTAVSASGSYYVSAFEPGSFCQYNVNFDVIALPDVELGPDQVLNACDNALPVNLFGLFTSVGNYTSWTYNGSPISGSNAMFATAPGVYQLINSTGYSCSDTVVVTLNINTPPDLGPDQLVSVCPGESADLTSLFNTTGYTVEWSYGGNVIPAPTAATNAGVYSLTASTGLFCADQVEVTLVADAPPALGADQAMDLCSNATLDLTPMYNTAGLIASWTLAGVPVADPSSISAAGNYQLIATNASGCTDMAMIAVNAIAPPALGADAAEDIWAGDVVDLTAVFSTVGLSAAWTLSGNTVPDPSAVGASGLYALIATNAIGCSDTAQVNVTVAANPLLGPDQSLTMCDGTEMDLTALYSTGTNATTWTQNGVPVADPAAIANAGSYTLTATNAAGCTSTAVVTLALDPAPALGADHSASICATSTFDLTTAFATNGLTPAWTLGGAPVANPSAVAVTGYYQLVVTNASGCTDTAVLDLTVNPNPTLGADLSFSLCPWQTVDLSAVFPVAGMTTTYALNGQPVGDPTTVSDPGDYIITVVDAGGCTDEAVASVSNVECLCVADFTHNARCMQEPAQFTLLADSAVLEAHWEFGTTSSSPDIDPVVRFTAEGDVLVTLQATLSCGVVTVQRTIHVDDCSDSCSVWIPVAFTPDNDGRNDTWTWSSACEAEDFSMLVFNRWGELLFTTTDPRSSWDGTYGGVLAQEGVYVYRASYILPYQKRKDVIGHITLVR